MRIVSATNANLPSWSSQGRFRQDLLFRLNTIEIRLPPLRERIEDIVPIAYRRLAGFAAKYGRRIEGFDEGALQVLRTYAWPGNVRELGNVIERAVLMARGAYITAIDLRLDLKSRRRRGARHRGHEPGRRRAAADPHGPEARGRQRQCRRRGARPEPECHVPPPGEAGHPHRRPIIDNAPRGGCMKISFENRLAATALLGGLPATLVALWLAWTQAPTVELRYVFVGLLLAAWIAGAIAVKRRIVFPLQTLSNLIEAVRYGDYSLRGRRARRGDTLGEVVWEINQLGETLQQQRTASMEASALVKTGCAVPHVKCHGRRQQVLPCATPGRDRLGPLPSEEFDGRPETPDGIYR